MRGADRSVGDVFVITTMKELLPQKISQPADYDPAKRKEVDRESTQQDMADFVTEFICSDVSAVGLARASSTDLDDKRQTIGLISSRWLEHADKSPRGIFDPGCLRLAQMHSLATDYPKTGLPVPVGDLPECNMRRGRPDWSAPETESSGRFYESQRYLGRLFREVHLPVPPRPQQPSRIREEPLPLQGVITFFHKDSRVSMNAVDAAVYDFVSPYIQAAPLHNRQHIEEVWKLFLEYVPRLRSICLSFSLCQRRSAMLAEEEVVAGTIVAQTSQPTLRKERMAQMREQISLLTDHIATRLHGGDGGYLYEVLKRAWIAFRLSAIRPESFGSKSFRFLAIHEIFDAIKRIVAEETVDSEGASSL